jgi:hypothetical protein
MIEQAKEAVRAAPVNAVSLHAQNFVSFALTKA